MPTATSSPAARSSARSCIDRRRLGRHRLPPCSRGESLADLHHRSSLRMPAVLDHQSPTTSAPTAPIALHNIERLQFADVDDSAAPTNVPDRHRCCQWHRSGRVEGCSTACRSGRDRRTPTASPVLSFQWQYQIIAAPGGTSQWVDIAGATGATFAPTDFLRWLRAACRGELHRRLGVKERVFSAPTATWCSIQPSTTRPRW